ncbi:hypothetical protein EW146_g6840 [Bondarzewia mesenterica]|uniref:Amino-acid acetyltransferase, mitochondrial n=1 Tax=Bondarzewia mesenterica TaxID=1095465 RepID=A0A4S4LPC7_9AGAM|nr:hypothetical protein EW146_g6840 [Bondarzewia mesenterica]
MKFKAEASWWDTQWKYQKHIGFLFFRHWEVILADYCCRFVACEECMNGIVAESKVYRHLFLTVTDRLGRDCDLELWTLSIAPFFSTNMSPFDMLPTELILKILENLDYQSILACQRVNRGLKELVDGSASLQYAVGLAAARSHDGPASHHSTAERLQTLREHQIAWRKLEWKEHAIFPMAVGNVWELYGGVFVQSNNHSKTLYFKQLPSVLRGIDMRDWDLTFEFRIRDFGIDPAQDLLIVIQESYQSGINVCNIHLRSISSGAAHSAAPKSSLLQHSLHAIQEDWSYSIIIDGDHLGILFINNEEADNEFVVWNWKSGDIILRLSRDNLNSFAFLDERFVMVAMLFGPIAPNPVLVIYDMSVPCATELDVETARFHCAFELPDIRTGVPLFGLDIRSDPSPNWTPSPDLHVPFHTEHRERLFVISLLGIVSRIQQGALDIFVTSRFFLDRAYMILEDQGKLTPYDDAGEEGEEEQYNVFTWDDWGACHTRVMIRESNWTAWVCYVFGMKYISPAVVTRDGVSKIQIFDFGSSRVRRAVQDGSLEEEWDLVSESSLVSYRWLQYGSISTNLPYLVKEIPLPPQIQDTPSFALMISEDTLIALEKVRSYLSVPSMIIEFSAGNSPFSNGPHMDFLIFAWCGEWSLTRYKASCTISYHFQFRPAPFILFSVVALSKALPLSQPLVTLSGGILDALSTGVAGVSRSHGGCKTAQSGAAAPPRDDMRTVPEPFYSVTRAKVMHMNHSLIVFGGQSFAAAGSKAQYAHTFKAFYATVRGLRERLEPEEHELPTNDFILSILRANPSARDAKSYLASFGPRPQPAPSPIHAPEPLQSRPETQDAVKAPTLTEEPKPSPLISSILNPVYRRTALVKIQGPFTDRQLESISRGMVYLEKLGLVSVIVVDSDGIPKGEEGEREQIVDETMRIVETLEKQGAKARPILSAVVRLGPKPGNDDSGEDPHVQIPEAHTLPSDLTPIRSALRSGEIPVLSPMALDSFCRSVRVDANDVVGALARGMVEAAALDTHEKRKPEGQLEFSDEVDLTPLRLMIINREGGVPSYARSGYPHLLINLASEYHHIQDTFQRPWESNHPTALSNLSLARTCLAYMPPTSSAVMVNHRVPSSLIANLITNKPAFSSSLPHALLQGNRSLTAHTPTLLRRGLDISVVKNVADIDRPKMTALLEQSFKRTLDLDAFYARLEKHLDFVIVAGDYAGAAIVTTEPCSGSPNFSSITYLDKFAVLPSHQGDGTVDFLWVALHDETYGLGLPNSVNPNGGKEGQGEGQDLVWRSRANNPINKWYFERSSGHIRMGDWVLFWCDAEKRLKTVEGRRASAGLSYVEDWERGRLSAWADAITRIPSSWKK